MTAMAISDFLPDFGKPAWRANDAASPFAPEKEAVARESAQPVTDLDAMISNEVERIETQITERLTAQYDEMLRVERENHAEEVERLQAELGAQAAAKITESMAELETQVTELATSVAARILNGLISDDIRHRSLEALADLIRGAVRGSGGVKVVVHGPLPLFERLSTLLEKHVQNVEHVEAPGFDLVVDIDGSLFETRLAEWSATFSEALS